MITKKYHHSTPVPQLLEQYGDISRMMFFDIETTGLSPKNSFVYLISFARFCGGELLLTQLFAEDAGEETAILKTFDEALTGVTLLAHFNGERFDIPYLKARYARHGLPSSLSCVASLDLYLYVKPFRSLFSCCNCKLKTMEQLLGLSREDQIDGGEAIRYYYQYVSTQDPYALDLCLLHNKEDVLNLPALSELLIFDQLKNAAGFPMEVSETDDSFSFTIPTGGHMSLTLSARFDDLRFTFSDNAASLRLDKHEGNLHLHYGDYRNYLYLPEEDYAVEASYGHLVGIRSAVKADIHTAFQPVPVPRSRNDLVYFWNRSYNWFLHTFDSKKRSAAR